MKRRVMQTLSKQDSDTQAVKVCADAYCDRSGVKLPLSEFSKNRAAHDQHDSYCSRCRLKRVHAYRERLREMKLNRKPFQKAWPTKRDRVREAIANGKHSRQEIRKATSLTMHEVVDSLAVLCFENEETVSRVVDGERKFFLAA